MESSLSRGVLDQFVSNANESIRMKLIRNENDLNDDDGDSFHPEFTHQFFGDSESIFGYRNLKVKLYYSASRLSSYLSINYSEKVTPDTGNGLDADDVLKVIAEKVLGHFYYNLDEFRASLSKESSFNPYGQLLHSFSIDDHCGDAIVARQIEAYKCDMSIPGFHAYHERMQTFLLWFIDAASYIDTDDDHWDYFVIYEKVPLNGNALTNGCVTETKNCTYNFIGYATVYKYYAYPQKIRPRISQFLVLPPYQKKGIGAQLLQIIYRHYCNDYSNVLDITVEDPSEDFTRLRDYVDAKNCMALDAFQSDNLKKGWNEAYAKDTQKQLKITKKQTRRVYEILRFRITNLSDDDDYKAYRLDVKRRLNAPFQRQQIEYKKLEKNGISAPELKATLLPDDIRISQLEKQYKQLEDDYRHTIERLATH